MSRTNFLVLAQSGAGEGLQYSLEPTWSWAPATLLLCVICAVVVVITVYLHERGNCRMPTRLVLAAIRLLLVSMVLTAMFGWVLHRDRTVLPDVVLLLDDSESMQFEDHYLNETLRARLTKRTGAVQLPGTTRLNLAKMLLLENNSALLEQLASRYNLKVFCIGASAREESVGDQEFSSFVRNLAANQTTSRLGSCLRDVLQLQRGRPTAAVILLTDGVTTEGKSVGEVAEYARRKSVALYIVGLGSDQTPRDVRITDVLVDDVVFVGDVVKWDVRLTATGCEDETILLRLRENEGGRVIAEQPVKLGKDGALQSVRLAHRPEKAGDLHCVVEFDALENEADTQNNRQQRVVSVRDDTIRVLLVQAYPSFEYRFLNTLLGRQLQGERPDAGRSIELTTVLQQADDLFAEADDTLRRVFPVRQDELFQYDVIIFGDVDPAKLGRLEMQNLVEFVRIRGGGIVFISGPRFTPLAYRDTPLAQLMPINVNTARVPNPMITIEEKFNIQPTQLGLATPAMQISDKPEHNLQTWHRLEGVYWLLDAPDLKPAARVLAEHPTRTGSSGRNLSVICMHFVGAGKVVFHSTDETYRWRFRVGDKYFARYWIQTIRYLSRVKLLGTSRTAELTSDFEQYRRGETVQLRVRFFDDRLAPEEDDGVTVVVERQAGTRRLMKLHRQAGDRGVFEGTITNLAEGRYRVWLASPTLSGQPPSLAISVVAPPREQARLTMDSADLKLAAKTTAGKFYTISNADRIVNDLPRGREVRIASLPPFSIWAAWPMALAFGLVFVVLIVSEWLVRRYVGML